MALIGNYNVFNKLVGKFLTGKSLYGNRSNWNTPGLNRIYYFGAFDQKSAIPNGYSNQTAWVMAQKSGGLGSTNKISFENNIDLILAGGVNIESNIDIYFDIINAQLGLIVAALCDIVTTIDINTDLVGIANLETNITQNISVGSQLAAIAELVSEINSAINVNIIPLAIGNLSANIGSTTELSPDSLASAIWNSIAANFNNPDTMGELLNNVGGSVSPSLIAEAVWDELKTGHTDPNSYGKIVQDLEQLIKQIKNLTIAGL